MYYLLIINYTLYISASAFKQRHCRSFDANAVIIDFFVVIFSININVTLLIVFANAIAAPAVEFKTEGMILGTAAKMFTIAGPVIVYGVSASVVYGLIYWITTLF